MSTELDILENSIDRLMKDIVEIDMRIARHSGNVSVGFTAIKEMSQNLKANAAKAIFSPKVTSRDVAIHKAVCSSGRTIKSVAKDYGCSPSTVRRSMDKVTENDMMVARS